MNALKTTRTTPCKAAAHRAMAKPLTALALVLACGASSAMAQVYVTSRVSITNANVQGTQNSTAPQINAAGTRVAFYGTSTELVSSPPLPGPPIIYVKNLSTGNIDWVTQRGDNESPPNFQPRPMGGVQSTMAISPTGRVFYTCSGDNSVAFASCPDSNGRTDVYDSNSGFGPTVSSLPGGFCGTAGNGDSSDPAISWDGNYVAFTSAATNFGFTDTNAVTDIYMKNISTGAMFRIGQPFGGQTNGASRSPSVANNGDLVAFVSVATNLSASANGFTQVYIQDRTQLFAPVSLVSTSTAGVIGNGTSDTPSVSSTGRYVAFVSLASNLVAGDSNGVQDVFLRDRQAGTTTRISVATDGSQANGASYSPVISADGRYVAFSSDATNLVAGDSNGTRDVFVRDTLLGTTTRISVGNNGGQSNGTSDKPSISADGSKIVFESNASNLTGGDTNAKYDIFMATLTPPPANDSCAGAIAIGLGSISGTTLGAGPSGATTCGFSAASPDAFYTLNLTRDAYIRSAVTAASYDTVLSLHTACPATSLNTIACDDDSGGASLSLIASTLLSAANPTTVRISGFNGLSGTYTLNFSEVAPPNDTCTVATDLTPLLTGRYTAATVKGSTVLAGTEGGTGCATSNSDVFYKLTPACTASYTIDTFGTTAIDTVLSVHSGCPASAINAVACNDDFAPPARFSKLTVTLNAGTTYYIRVAAFGTVTSQGGFTLNVVNNDGLTNDESSNPAFIPVGSSVSYNACQATTSLDVPTCAGLVNHFNNDVWFTTVSTSDSVPLTIHTVGSGTDTTLQVTSGSLADCSDDAPGLGNKSLLRIYAPAGQPVRIRVGNYFAGQPNTINQVTVTQCLADVAGGDVLAPDGTVDGADFVAFINSFAIGDPNISALADVNLDGVIDGNDFVAFINAFAVGC